MKTLELQQAAPDSEVSAKFLQGMLDRMAVSYAKYGAVASAYPSKVDAVESLRVRLDKYLATGNTEFLMDVANFAMIEFMHPNMRDAHFRATDARESPGRVWHGEVNPVQDRNIPERID